MPQFDIQGARKAGYSDDEIIAHLAKSRNFDVDGAKKSGYSSQEILSHLSPDSITQPEAEKPTMGSRFYENTVGMVKGAAEKFANTPGSNPFVRAAEAFVVDPIVGMAQRTIGSKAPGPLKIFDTLGSLVVPDTAAKDIAEGNYTAALGGIGGNATMMMLPGLAGRASKAAPTTLRNMGTAVKRPASAIESFLPQKGGTMQAAVDYAQKRGIPTTVGERTGSPMLQTVERMAEMTPGASGVATDFFMDRNAQILGNARGIVKKMGGAAEDRTAAAQTVVERTGQRTTNLSDYASKKYSEVRSSIENNKAKLQAEADAQYAAESSQITAENAASERAYQQRRQAVAAAGGNPDTVPVPEKLPLPQKPTIASGAEVDLAPIKQKLQPLYDEMSRTMPTTMKEASPGYTRLKAIVEDANTSRSAIDLDRDLSEIKRVLRSEGKGYASTQSGRYAAATINAIESEVQKAIELAGGKKAVNDLMQGRAAVRKLHEVADVMDQILPKGESPAILFERAVRDGDKNLNKLMALKKATPNGVNEIAATYLDGALSKISGEAGQADLAAASNAWKRLGPRTKQELYGLNVGELDAFFENAPKLIRNVNKSGSGYATQASRVLNASGLVLGAFTGGLGGMAEGAALTSASMASTNMLAKFLFRKGNPTLLMDAMKYPPNSSAGITAMKRLNAAALKEPEIAAFITAQNSGGIQKRP